MNYMQLALRNIFRHRKRSIVTILTVCLGFTALGVISGMVNNIFSRLKGQAIVVEKLGHITFAKEGFFKHGKMEPEAYLWEKAEMEGILQILRADGDVAIATPRLSLFGIASNGNASTIFITEAIVPEEDQRLITTKVDGRKNTRGAISLEGDESKRTEVAIGEELATNLGIEEGGFFTLLTSTKDGMANAMDADVVEIFNTGNPATNDKFVLTNFELAQELYDTEGAQRIVVTLKDDTKVAQAKDRLLTQLAAAGYQVEAEAWNERSLFYEKIKTTFSAVFRVLTVIITVVVLLTLLNTMQMSVAERTREIGTMRAIGMLKKDVIKLFCLEGLIMGVIACILALPVLMMISNILEFLNITFIPPVASVPVPIMLILRPQNLLLVFGLFCAASLLSSFMASNKISKQKIVDALIPMS
ncbi:MAG: FtsX-like permease family protein [Bacteroidota bacterium]